MSVFKSIITHQKRKIFRKNMVESQLSEKVARMQATIDGLQQQLDRQREDAAIDAAKASAELKVAKKQNGDLAKELAEKRESVAVAATQNGHLTKELAKKCESVAKSNNETKRVSAKATRLQKKLDIARQKNKDKDLTISAFEEDKADSEQKAYEDATSEMDLDDPKEQLAESQKKVDKLTEESEKRRETVNRLESEKTEVSRQLEETKTALAKCQSKLKTGPATNSKSNQEPLDEEMQDAYALPSCEPPRSLSAASGVHPMASSDFGSSTSSFASSRGSKASTASTANTSPLSSTSKSPMESSEDGTFELINGPRSKIGTDIWAALDKSRSRRFDPRRAGSSNHRGRRKALKAQYSTKQRARQATRVLGGQTRQAVDENPEEGTKEEPKQDLGQLGEEKAVDEDDEDDETDEDDDESDEDDEDDDGDDDDDKPEEDKPEKDKPELLKTGSEFSDEENERRAAANRDFVYVWVKQAYSDGMHWRLKNYRGQWLMTSDESTQMYSSMHPDAADMVLAEMVSQGQIDSDKNPYLPYNNGRIKIENLEDDRDEGEEIETGDFSKQCVMAHFPELHMQAAAGALFGDRQTYDKFAAKYERERGKDKVAPEQQLVLFRTAWRRARTILAGLKEFRQACIAWANDEPSKGKWCWPPTFNDPEIVKKTSLTPEADIAANKAAEEADAMANVFQKKTDVNRKYDYEDFIAEGIGSTLSHKPESEDGAKSKDEDELTAAMDSSSSSSAEKRGRGGFSGMFGPLKD